MKSAKHSGFINNKLRRLQIKLDHNKSNQMLVFGEKGKPEYLGKNLSEQNRESTDSAHIMMAHQEIEPGPYWWGVSALTTGPINPAL